MLFGINIKKKKKRHGGTPGMRGTNPIEPEEEWCKP